MKKSTAFIIGAVIALVAYFGFIQPRLGGGGGTSFAQQRSSANTMTAEINGKKVTLERVKSMIGTGRIYVTYCSYNPRGEVDMTVQMDFDKNIEPGTYSIEDRDGMLRIEARINGKTLHARYNPYLDSIAAQRANGYTGYAGSVPPGKLGQRFNGSYTLQLTGRSDDWRTYTGRLNAVVESMQTDDTATITNATFNFTL